MKSYDVIIVGAGPAGSTAACILAAAGKRVLILDKSKFPRDKVCGDCLNPSAWRILGRLDLSETIRSHQPTIVRRVEFCGASNESAAVNIPDSVFPEIVIRRRDLDAVLVTHAVARGAEFLDDTPVTAISRAWRVSTPKGEFSAPVLLAADGRNSTVGRMTARLPAASRERIALQAHVSGKRLAVGNTVRMFFHRHGYGGIAALNPDETNLCLVAKASEINALRAYAERMFGLGPETVWNSISPLQRPDATSVASDGVFLLGDAARVVEPFTGEGIYYAMRSAELAADALLGCRDLRAAEQDYTAAHSTIYSGRLWVNALSRFAALRPQLISRILPICNLFPGVLSLLTRKVVVLKG